MLDAAPGEQEPIAIETAPVLPRLASGPDRESHLLRLRVEGTTDGTYSLQVSPDLQHWQDWTNRVFNPTSGYYETHMQTEPAAQFYRARFE